MNAVRETSLEAYNYIIENGILSKRMTEAYRNILHYGPVTGNELCKLMKKPGQWKLMAPLKERGLITEVGKRRCNVTGYNAFAWDVTGNLPSKPEKFKSKDAIIRELRWEIHKLKLQVLRGA